MAFHELMLEIEGCFCRKKYWSILAHKIKPIDGLKSLCRNFEAILAGRMSSSQSHSFFLAFLIYKIPCTLPLGKSPYRITSSTWKKTWKITFNIVQYWWHLLLVLCVDIFPWRVTPLLCRWLLVATNWPRFDRKKV